MKFPILLTVFCCAIAVQAKLLLADNGRTLYHAHGYSNKMKQEEIFALRDLRNILKEISGADFATSKGKKYQIVVGKAAPSDKRPLKKHERRIVSENGSIYIWGEGRHGNTNAVYDFLRDVMGCKWFTISGDKLIPSRRRIEIDDLNYSFIPTVPVVTVNAVTPSSLSCIIDFARRHGFTARTDGLIGPNGHSPRQLIPCGVIPYGGREGNLYGPWETVKDKAYFKTNPEFFSMDAKGRRTRGMHLCFSNQALRDEFVKNISDMLIKSNYSGEAADVALDHDDRGGRFCLCPECIALEKKYDHPAGAYFDFVLYAADKIGKMYPNVMLHIIAYRKEQTLHPPKPDKLKMFPPNVMVRYAPLGVDFSKPYPHHSNRLEAKLFRDWSKVTHHMRWSAYPGSYPRPTVNFPLTANIHRSVQNIDFACGNGIINAYLEFGAGPQDAFSFTDLRLYIYCEKLRRIDVNEAELIREFTDACYGKAAPGIRKYLAELEEKELGTDKFMRWNPQVLYVDYATAENMLRWTADFEAMEKTAADNPRNLLNLRRARYSLDQTIVARWPYLTPEEQQKFGDIEKIIARCEKTINDHNADLASCLSDKARRARYIKGRFAWYNSGLEQLSCVARGGKPLPGFLQKKKTVYRILPNRNKLPLTKDPEAGFGLANFGTYPKHNRPIFILHYFDHAKRSTMLRWDVPKALNRKRIEKTAKDTGYHWYHLGAVPMREDGMLMFNSVSNQAYFALGHLYDKKDPDQLYDLYVSLAADKKKGLIRIDQLAVVPLKGKKLKAPKQNNKEASGVDMFM